MPRKKYRVYCKDEKKFVTTWADTKPSTCPNNGSHKIRAVLVIDDGVLNEDASVVVDDSGNLQNITKLMVGITSENNYITTIHGTADKNGLFIKSSEDSGTSPFHIETYSGGQVLHIDNSGKIGFGTQTPTETIDVSGNIIVTGTVNGRNISVDGSTLDTHVGETNKHIDHSTISIIGGGALTGGGDLTSSRTITFDYTTFAADGAPNGATDFALVYDTSAGTYKKVLLDDFPSGGGGPVFGSQYHFQEDTSESNTTSNNYQQKLRLTTGSLPDGTYRLGWFYNWRHTQTSRDFKAQLELDDTTVIMEHFEEPKDQEPDQKYSSSGFINLDLVGVHTIDLDYCRNQGGASYIWNVRLELWRVS